MYRFAMLIAMLIAMFSLTTACGGVSEEIITMSDDIDNDGRIDWFVDGVLPLSDLAVENEDAVGQGLVVCVATTRLAWNNSPTAFRGCNNTGSDDEYVVNVNRSSSATINGGTYKCNQMTATDAAGAVVQGNWYNAAEARCVNDQSADFDARLCASTIGDLDFLDDFVVPDGHGGYFFTAYIDWINNRLVPGPTENMCEAWDSQ